MGQLYRVASVVSDSRLGLRLDVGCGEESTMADIVTSSFLCKCGRCQPWLHQPAPMRTMLALVSQEESLELYQRLNCGFAMVIEFLTIS
jgi:hypothetical protein